MKLTWAWSQSFNTQIFSFQHAAEAWPVQIQSPCANLPPLHTLCIHTGKHVQIHMYLLANNVKDILQSTTHPLIFWVVSFKPHTHISIHSCRFSPNPAVLSCYNSSEPRASERGGSPTLCFHRLQHLDLYTSFLWCPVWGQGHVGGSKRNRRISLVKDNILRSEVNKRNENLCGMV